MTDYLSLINDISTQSLDTIINNDTSNFLQDEEPPILVDALTRTFTLQPGFHPVVGIRTDHNSNAITFNCPRFIDGYDILKCSSKLVKWYNTGAKVDGFYTIEDMQVMEDNPDMVEFSWIIKGSITTAPGRIQFSLIFIDVDTATNTECYRWNSTINTNLSIGDGLYNPDIDDMDKIKDSANFELIFVDDLEVKQMLQEVYGKQI